MRKGHPPAVWWAFICPKEKLTFLVLHSLMRYSCLATISGELEDRAGTTASNLAFASLGLWGGDGRGGVAQRYAR